MKTTHVRLRLPFWIIGGVLVVFGLCKWVHDASLTGRATQLVSLTIRAKGKALADVLSTPARNDRLSVESYLADVDVSGPNAVLKSTMTFVADASAVGSAGEIPVEIPTGHREDVWYHVSFSYLDAKNHQAGVRVVDGPSTCESTDTAPSPTPKSTVGRSGERFPHAATMVTVCMPSAAAARDDSGYRFTLLETETLEEPKRAKLTVDDQAKPPMDEPDRRQDRLTVTGINANWFREVKSYEVCLKTPRELLSYASPVYKSGEPELDTDGFEIMRAAVTKNEKCRPSLAKGAALDVRFASPKGPTLLFFEEQLSTPELEQSKILDPHLAMRQLRPQENRLASITNASFVVSP